MKNAKFLSLSLLLFFALSLSACNSAKKKDAQLANAEVTASACAGCSQACSAAEKAECADVHIKDADKKTCCSDKTAEKKTCCSDKATDKKTCCSDKDGEKKACSCDADKKSCEGCKDKDAKACAGECGGECGGDKATACACSSDKAGKTECSGDKAE